MVPCSAVVGSRDGGVAILPNPVILKESLSYDPNYLSTGTQTMLDRTEVHTQKHTINHQKIVGWYRAVLSSEPEMAVLPSQGNTAIFQRKLRL